MEGSDGHDNHLFDRIDSLRKFCRDQLGINKRFLLLLASAAVGILVSFVAILLSRCMEWLAHATYLNPSLNDYHFLMPAIGGLFVGLYVYFAKSDHRQKGGVEDIIKFIRLKRDTVSIRDIVTRFITSSITLGTGGSAGKEAPVVHLGGGIGATLGRLLRFPDSFVKTLAGAGVAAGIASAFQAPIAGSFFALEILLASFTLDTFSMVIIAGVTSTAVAQKLGHATTHVHIVANVLQNPINLLFFSLIGVLGGVVTLFFIRSLHFWESVFSSLSIPVWIKPATGGLLLGLLCYAFPGAYGEGYNVMNLLLSGNFSNFVYYVPVVAGAGIGAGLVIMLFIKILATSLTLGSGNAGGTIVPALFIGTNLGAVVAYLAQTLFPEINISGSTWVLVGMSAVLAPMTQAPIFAIMLFFELTHSYEVLLPVLIVTSLSILICRHYLNGSLYSVTLEREGIRLYRGMEQSVMETMQVKEIAHQKINIIDRNVTLTTILNGFFHSHFMAGLVVDDNNRFMGVITLEGVKKYIKNQPLCDLLLASEMATEKDMWVLPEDNLMHSLEMMDKTDQVFLPVLENRDTKKPIGYITRKDIVKLYNRQVIKRGAQNILIEKDGTSSMDNYLQVGEEFQIHTMPCPRSWVNKTLKGIDLRVRYNLTVIGIKKEDEISYIIPDINYLFRRGDSITVVGKSADIEQLLNDLGKSKNVLDILKSKLRK